MKKLFTVTQDMDNMSKDQLKGAVRNMESLSNAMYVAIEDLFSSHFDDEDEITVLTMTTEHWIAPIKRFYLPSIDGRTVIIELSRPDSLMRWKLQFFARYGNLFLDAIIEDDSVHFEVSDDNIHTKNHDNWLKCITDRRDRVRSDASLYESMRNSKKF